MGRYAVTVCYKRYPSKIRYKIKIIEIYFFLKKSFSFVQNNFSGRKINKVSIKLSLHIKIYMAVLKNGFQTNYKMSTFSFKINQSTSFKYYLLPHIILGYENKF